MNLQPPIPPRPFPPSIPTPPIIISPITNKTHSIYSKQGIVSEAELDSRITDIRSASPEKRDTSTRDSGEIKTYQTALNAFEQTHIMLDF